MEQKDSDNPFGEDEAGRSAGRIPVIKIKIPMREEEETRRSHYCKECKKSFNSGKALGGHMSSAHVQANKDYSLKKLSSKRKSPDHNICIICDRVFQSQKSLFGHMRCHPEREWRGMEPPPEDKLGVFDIKGWPTSKRGRAPVSSLKDKEKEKEDELYMTAIEVLSSGKMERETPSSGKYKCNECARVFSTHQALGGHRSSHNKFKITVVNTNAPDLKPKKMSKKIAATAFSFDLNVAPPQEEEEDSSTS